MNENDETLEFFEFEESYEVIFNVLLNPLQTECSEKVSYLWQNMVGLHTNYFYIK